MKLAILPTDDKHHLPEIYYFDKISSISQIFQDTYLIYSYRNHNIKVLLKPLVSKETFGQIFGKQYQYKEESIRKEYPDVKGYLIMPSYLRTYLKHAFHDFVIL